MTERPTGADRARTFLRVADMVDTLHRAVSALASEYEANDWLNDVQPEGFSAILAGSLDEWAPSIPEVARAWRALADRESSRWVAEGIGCEAVIYCIGDASKPGARALSVTPDDGETSEAFNDRVLAIVAALNTNRAQ